MAVCALRCDRHVAAATRLGAVTTLTGSYRVAPGRPGRGHVGYDLGVASAAEFVLNIVPVQLPPLVGAGSLGSFENLAPSDRKGAISHNAQERGGHQGQDSSTDRDPSGPQCAKEISHFCLRWYHAAP